MRLRVEESLRMVGVLKVEMGSRQAMHFLLER